MDFDDIPAELLLDALEKAEDMVETMVEPDHETDRPMDQPSHHKLDRLAYQTWIYPTNCSERLYQLNMVQSALFHNTLVALPTGLGKTFIGAVVMFNYFQWFPESKIIFMAPTKPLVAQQIDACYNITGIPPEVTCELTGSTSAELRSQIWAQKRVFYVTPQILQNDLSSGLCPANNISLLVIDEAHRATGNYAYCQLIKELVNRGAIFRVLALTATPGSDAKSVQSVLDNILCEKIEIRTEDSMDIQPFIFKRAIQEVIVPSSDFINELTAKFSKSIEPFLKRLCAAKAFTSHDPLAVSSYYLITQRNRWRTTSTLSGPQKGAIEGDFVVAIALSRCLGLLQSHGIRTFSKNLSAFIEEIKASPKISTAKTKIINDPNIQTLMAQINSQSTLNSFVSHPKHEKLVSIILEHFLESADQKEVDTKVMIFTQYRDSVEEIVSILSEHNPMVRVMSFIGQSSSKKGSGKGLTQKEQLKVIRDFQNGNFNVLVSTSIGEEGLDIGEIDLIICFDSQASPIRMLQRMGRTGRKRKGKIVLLLSKGKEEESYRQANAKYKSVQKTITDGNQKLSFYTGPNSHILPKPRPVCEKKLLCIERKASIPLPPKPANMRSTKGKKDTSSYLNNEQMALLQSSYADIDESNFAQDITPWQKDPLPHKIIPRSTKSLLYQSIVSFSSKEKELKALQDKTMGKFDIFDQIDLDELGGSPIENSPQSDEEFDMLWLEKKRMREKSFREASDVDRFRSNPDFNNELESSEPIVIDDAFEDIKNPPDVSEPIPSDNEPPDTKVLPMDESSGSFAKHLFGKSTNNIFPFTPNNPFFRKMHTPVLKTSGINQMDRFRNLNHLAGSIQFEYTSIETPRLHGILEAADAIEDRTDLDKKDNTQAQLAQPKSQSFSSSPVRAPNAKRKMIVEQSSSPQITRRRLMVPSTSSPQVSPGFGVRRNLVPDIKSSCPSPNEEYVKRSTPLAERLALKKQPRKPPKERASPIITKEDRVSKVKKSKKSRPKMPIPELFDYEAQVSSDISISADEDSNNDSEANCSFVTGSQSSIGNMHQIYMKSLLSPEQGGMGRKYGSKYRLAELRRPIVLSQTPGPESQDSSMDDFVVNDNLPDEEQSELCSIQDSNQAVNQDTGSIKPREEMLPASYLIESQYLSELSELVNIEHEEQHDIEEGKYISNSKGLVSGVENANEDELEQLVEIEPEESFHTEEFDFNFTNDDLNQVLGIEQEGAVCIDDLSGLVNFEKDVNIELHELLCIEKENSSNLKGLVDFGDGELDQLVGIQDSISAKQVAKPWQKTITEMSEEFVFE